MHGLRSGPVGVQAGEEGHRGLNAARHAPRVARPLAGSAPRTGHQRRSAAAIDGSSERVSAHRRVLFAGVRVVPIIMSERILLAGVVVFHCISHDVTATASFELANDCTCTRSSGLLEVTMLP